MSDFIHLHCHSEFSTLDAMPNVEQYIMKVNKLNMPGIALTEHGNLRSLFQLYSKARGKFFYEGIDYDFNPVNPIAGCEFYLTLNDYKTKGLPESEKDKIKRESKNAVEAKRKIKQREFEVGTKQRFHLLAFAKNNEGLRNIYILNYLSWKNGFYYRPRIDLRLLLKYRKGIIVTSGCIGGLIPKALLADNFKVADKLAKLFKKYFKDDFYVELQPHNLDDQKKANVLLKGLAEKCDAKMIATNDCHYLDKDDWKAHEVLLAINSRATLQSQDRWRFGDNQFYLKTKDEMLRTFKKYHRDLGVNTIKTALENTMEINEKCSVKMTIDKKQAILPVYKLPEGYLKNEKYVIDLCKDGWKWRNIEKRIKEYAKFKGISVSKSRQIYKNRLKLELSRMFKMKFVTYFLIIYDMVRWARSQDIMIGAGRGSSTASLVCYLLGITGVDPIRYNLLFDRFLSEYRLDYPDIDLDFEDIRRKEIFKYLFDKYGYNKSCLVGTMDRMKGKLVLQDVGRVMGIPLKETLEVTKHIVLRAEGDARMSQTVEDAFKEFDVSKRYNKNHPEVLPLVKKLEGKARQVGIHAAAIQIAPYSLYKHLPIEFREDRKMGERMPISAYDWRDCQDLGLLKIDILGLGTLTALKYAVQEIKRIKEIDLDLESVDLEDKNVLKNFSKLKFSGIFQFDSIGMRNVCEDFPFDSFDDIIALTALYRPGGMRSGQSKTYAIRKKKKNIKKIHPVYDEITKDTYGVMVYQEQLMQMFMKVAGYQPGKADLVRKKISKSHGQESMWREKTDFFEGAKKNNFPPKIAKWLFRNMSFFGSYAFNKAHAASYATIAYWGMYLKTYYPTEFYYGLLKQESTDEKISDFIKEAKSAGIKVKLPDVNESEIEFSIIKENVISYGLMDVKTCGEKASDEIANNKPYTSLFNFCEKVNRRKVNIGVIRSLAKAGAFKSLYSNTGALLAMTKDEKDNEVMVIEKMVSMSEKDGNKLYKRFDKKEYSLNKEQEEKMISSVSSIPTDKHLIEYYNFLDDKLYSKHNNVKIKDIDFSDTKAVVKGLLLDIKYNNVGDFHKEPPDDKTKKRIHWGKRYCSVNLEDETGIKRVSVNIEVFDTFRHIIDKGVGEPVIMAVKPMSFNSMLSAYIVSGLTEFRSIIESNKPLKVAYKKMDAFQRYFIKHPVAFIKNERVKLKVVNKRKAGEYYIIGLINRVRSHWTKDDREMAFVEIEDEDVSLSVTVWSDELKKYRKILRGGNIIGLTVNKNSRGMTANNDIKLIKEIYQLK